MKPVYLEFCGINYFSEPAKINFNSLLEFGIFGIFGDTGSGKSTILDSIGFALYGNVARAHLNTDIINFRLDRAYVIFEFEIFFEGERRTFRIEREIKRKKASQSIRVYERKGEQLAALADGPRDANPLLSRIIGLEQKDFEKCIALPQGEFAQFVKSAPADRVKLISRLFDLEKYGERLKERAKERYNQLKGESDTLATRLEPYAEVTPEAIKAVEAEICVLKERGEALEKQVASLRETERELSGKAEKRRELEKLTERFACLEEKREAFAALNGELSRLEKANAVAARGKEHELAERRAEQAAASLTGAKARLERAEQAKNALPAYDEEGAEAEIARLSEQKARAEAGEETLGRLKNAEQEIARKRKQLELLVPRLIDPNYETQKAEIERLLAQAPEEDFLAFLEGHGKEALMRGEYAVFAQELKTLEEKYPFISPDSAPLIARYRALAEGERTDFSTLKQAFEARTKAREAAHAAQISLEKANEKFKADLKESENLKIEIRKLEEEYASLSEQATRIPLLAEATAALEEKRREKKRNAEARSNADAELSAANAAFAVAFERNASAQRELEEAKNRLAQALEDGNFRSAQEARELATKYGDAEAARERVEAYKTEYAEVRGRLRALRQEDVSSATEEAVYQAREALKVAVEEERACTKTLALRQAEHSRLEEYYKIKLELSALYAKKERETKIAERLKKLLDGNKFMEFVAEEYLQTVAYNASSRLLSLTGGRYFLRYEGGFFVGDNFNGGALRAVYTLSGGETFLVSLSLALALSAEICTKSARPIEFFFLDEGFGTLDERLVDTVMDSLEKLKSENFSIGIISHVEELKHRIERKLLVKKATEKHGSQISGE